MRAILAPAFALAVAVALHGQQPMPSEPSFRSATSELVVLPVSVTDKQGRFVAALPSDRFSVLDNGRRQPIAFFSNEDAPVTVGLVIDNSGSMRTKMGEVVAATLAFARSSNPLDELFAIEFNDDVRSALKEHTFLLTSDFSALKSDLLMLRPEGRTALYDALVAALAHLDEGHRARKVLILISDGGDNASRATLDEVLADARRSSTSVYTIGLFEPDDVDKNPGVLNSIAKTTGGARFLPESPSQLLRACEEIAREIRNGYTIGYEPPDRDGVYHRVQVQIQATDRRLIVRTRPGYVAPGGTDRP